MKWPQLYNAFSLIAYHKYVVSGSLRSSHFAHFFVNHFSCQIRGKLAAIALDEAFLLRDDLQVPTRTSSLPTFVEANPSKKNETSRCAFFFISRGVVLKVAVEKKLAEVIPSYGYEVLKALVVRLDPAESVKREMNQIYTETLTRQAATEVGAASVIERANAHKFLKWLFKISLPLVWLLTAAPPPLSQHTPCTDRAEPQRGTDYPGPGPGREEAALRGRHVADAAGVPQRRGLESGRIRPPRLQPWGLCPVVE